MKSIKKILFEKTLTKNLISLLEKTSGQTVVLKEKTTKEKTMLLAKVHQIISQLGYGEPVHSEIENGRNVLWVTMGEGDNHKEELKALKQLNKATEGLPIDIQMYVIAESTETDKAFYPVKITI